MVFPLIPLLLNLAPYVPAVTRWLSGDNPGPVAETIGNIATTVTGSSSIQEAVQRIAAEPELQRRFQLAMQERADEIEKAYLADRQSARDRDMRIQVATGRNRRGDLLAGLAVVGLLATIAALFFGPDVTGANRDLLLVTLGSLITIVKDVYGFEFGSSKESARNINAVTDYLKNGGTRK